MSGTYPSFLYQDRDTAYVNARYDAAISWIDEMGHMAVSNGPFYLGSTERDGSGSITRMTLEQFDDSTYPFEAGRVELVCSHAGTAVRRGRYRVPRVGDGGRGTGMERR